MSYQDPNKQHRDKQRRFLNKAGWKAVDALKKNGSFKNAWIHSTRKGSYSREDAFALASKAK